MNVLYLLFHPDALSESYIRTEVEWMQRQGVRVSILAHAPHTSTYPNTVRDVQIGGTVESAIERFEPDLIQVHWMLVVTWLYLDEIEKIQIPITVRGHSFDFTRKRAEQLAVLDSIRRIWLFPHFAAEVLHPKVRPLTCCYEGAIYTPGTPRRPGQVLRVAAGIPRKGIEEFIEIARACPGIKFVLAMTRALAPDDAYPERIIASAPTNVEVRLNLQREELRSLMQESSIYLRGNGSRHAFGMPVSIAEALGCGLLVVAPDVPVARSYIGDAGRFYNSVPEAVDIVKEALAWPDAAWQSARSASLARAELYRTDRVLPTILDQWRALVS